MPTLQYNVSVSGGGLTTSIAQNTPRTADGGSAAEVTVPKGYAGTLTTRTDNETGTLTLGDGHGITTGQTIDLYWSGGARYGITVGTVSGNSVPIGADDSGTGSNLPVASTAIIASPQLELNCSIDGDALSLLALQLAYANVLTDADGYIRFYDDAEDLIAALSLESFAVIAYDLAGGMTNPFTGDPITHAIVSHSDTALDATLRLAWVQDITP